MKVLAYSVFKSQMLSVDGDLTTKRAAQSGLFCFVHNTVNVSPQPTQDGVITIQCIKMTVAFS